ncbi:prepilin-type N-terminal cleavage/methylation domain-containing protein [Ornithinibacillus sp. JPR2-1]|uniref:prepilin-type N-terminal cleavage/methylation domain-containing protein n=1 Tax=Ornithinibacillus sp. JPR2-1 TaxID=2094019 RepID=UPI0031D48566
MRNSKGFTMTEALVSLAVLIVISTALLPLTSFISLEREALSLKRAITYHLHDELQSVLWYGVPADTYYESIEQVEIEMTFTVMEDDIIQGCANWININNRQEEVCLYGAQE